MGLKLASTFAITALFALMYALVFVIGVYFLPEGILGLIIMIFLVLGIVFLQYAISPIIIGWIYRIQWIPFEQYKHEFPHLAKVIEKVCNEKRIKIPRVGVIRDLNPNAFCYGWSKGTARVVITEGILKYLNQEEQRAVVGHEMGHVIHNDFILMTIVFAIPILLLTIARWAYYSARFSSLSKKSDEGTYFTLALYAIAVLSYITYWIGYLISLFISRIREYYADEYSAEVLENPNALSTGLVKIAYGLLEVGADVDNRRSRVRGLRGLGIMDSQKAHEYAYTTMEQSGKVSNDAVAAAAAWDLFNPWARYFQLFSTHPLPAKRILRLNDQCPIYNKKPEIDLSRSKKIKEEQAGKSMIPEFITDLYIKVAPILVLVLLIVTTAILIIGAAGLITVFGLTAKTFIAVLNQIFLIWALGFVIIGIAVILRTGFMFRKDYQPQKVRGLVTNIKVSPVRCVPAIIEGRIVGKGVPGYWLSEDLYFQDNTGLMYVDYRSGIPLIGDLIFALARVRKLIGQNVRIVGWYRRGPGPYIQVQRIEAPGLGRSFKSHYKGVTYFWAILAFLIALVCFYIWSSGFTI